MAVIRINEPHAKEMTPDPGGPGCAAPRAGLWYDTRMLSEATIRAYRSMSIEERWQEVEELMTLAWRTLQELPDDEFERRLAAIRAEHEASDAALLERLRSVS